MQKADKRRHGESLPDRSGQDEITNCMYKILSLRLLRKRIHMEWTNKVHTHHYVLAGCSRTLS